MLKYRRGITCVLLLYLFTAQANALRFIFSEFDIHEQSLADALSAVSQQKGVQLVYESELVNGLLAPSVKGYLTLDTVLKKLLSNTELEYEVVDGNTLVIRKMTPTRDLPSALADSAKAKSPVPIEVVHVTGSRIPRPEVDILFPTQIITSDFIENGSFATLGDVINSLPILGTSVYSLDVSTNTRNIGATFADLYNLGSQRTLTLVNGHRFVSVNEPALFVNDPGLQVDLNLFSKQIIDRIELISVGGSPVYGSDAIAGTVNLILKENFQGFEVNAEAGQSHQHDGDSHTLGFLFGRKFAQDQGNITVAYEYFDQQSIAATDRYYTRKDFGYVSNPDNTGPEDGIPDNIFTAEITNASRTIEGIPAPLPQIPPVISLGINHFIDSDGRPITFDETGRLRPFDLGESTGNPFITSGGEGDRFSEEWAIRLPLERHALNTVGHLHFNEDLRLFGELHYASAKSQSPDRGGFVNSGFFTGDNGPLPISINNPFLDENDRNLLIDNGLDPLNGQFFLNKELADIIDGRFFSDTKVYSTLLGLDGTLLFSGDWHWQITANFGRSKTTTILSDLIENNFREAIDTEVADNTIVCRSQNPQCVPLNPMGIVRDQAAIDYVTTSITEEGRMEQDIYTALLRTESLDVGSLPLSLLVGFELRREASSFDPGAFSISGAGRLVPRHRVSGHFDTQEWFAETLFPLVEESSLPYLDTISLEGSWRHVNHSKAGSDTTWTVGGRLVFPLTDSGKLILRGNTTKSIRAPAINESFRTPTAAVTVANDPCDSRFVSEDVERLNNCISAAEAVGANYDPENFLSAIINGSEVTVTSDPNLANEQARARSLGVVVAPRSGDQFLLALDWIETKVTDVIFETRLNTMLDRCYNSGDVAACDTFSRDPETFQVTTINSRFRNTGERSVKGLQLSANGQLQLSQTLGLPGSLGVALSAYKIDEFIINNDIFNGDTAGALLFPEWRWHVGLEYQWQDLTIAWFSRFHDKVRPFAGASAEFADNAAIGDYWVHTVSSSLKLSEAISIRVGIRNVLDADIPGNLPSAALEGSIYDAVGRYYSLSLKYKHH